MKPPTLRPFLPRPALRRRPIRAAILLYNFHRSYAVQQPGAPTLEVFNRKVKHLQKDRAGQNVADSRNVDYLRDEVAERLCERLLDIRRTFPSVLDLGSHALNLARALSLPPTPESTPSSPSLPPLAERISHLTCTDTSHNILYRDDPFPFAPHFTIDRQVLPDLEYLPYTPKSFDAVLSSLSLHWINDLPSLLSQINTVLKPDSPFLAAMLGGDTLFELRTSLQLAEQDRRGGVSPHVSPLADVRDVGGLLTKAGFKMLTVDVDDIVVEYPDIFALMTDLQAMGESNAVLRRETGPISRDTLLAASGIYKELHGEEGREGIPATFRVIYMIGWTEGEGQQKPLQRGSGQVNLKDVLGGGSIGGGGS